MCRYKSDPVDLVRILIALMLGFAAGAWAGVPYDPSTPGRQASFAISDMTIHDARRDRDIPVRLYLPGGSGASPLILFSPGLGGSRAGYAYLAKHWALRGYAVVVLQHPGSDDAIWKGKPKAEAIAAMRHAASGRNFLARIFDVKAVLNQLSEWARDSGSPWSGRFDLSEIGMAGHSFGAVTSEAVSGERFRGRAMFTDPRIRAALLLSPSSPRRGTPDEAFGEVGIPWMLMTGTRDTGLLGLGAKTVQSRLAVYAALPPGDKYELVLAGAQHMAFSDRQIMGRGGQRNPNDHRAIVAISTAFWDARLKHDTAAQAWLRQSVASVLKPGDKWYMK